MSIVYLFEDSKHSPISELFRFSYTDKSVESLIYAEGAGNIQKIAERLINKGNEVVVFIDLVVDNPNTYTNLSLLLNYIGLDLYTRDKLLIIPIFCSEYYVVRALVTEGLLSIQDTLIRDCVNLEDYRKHNIPNKYSKSFEKYCKYIVEQYGIMCTRNSPYTIHKNIRRKYFTSDCICLSDKPFDICYTLSLQQKGIDLLKEYPMVPAGSSLQNYGGHTLSIQEIKKILGELVQLHIKSTITFGNYVESSNINQFMFLLQKMSRIYNL